MRTIGFGLEAMPEIVKKYPKRGECIYFEVRKDWGNEDYICTNRLSNKKFCDRKCKYFSPPIK